MKFWQLITFRINIVKFNIPANITTPTHHQSYNYPQELKKEIFWPTFLVSLVCLKREVYSTYFSGFFSIIIFFLWLLIKARGRCDQALCDCFSLSRAGRCRPLQASSELCHWLQQNPPAPPALVLQLYTQYKLWARGGCRGASIQGAANCRVSIIPTELSPGAAGCRVNFSSRCWHCHHPPACTFSL